MRVFLEPGWLRAALMSHFIARKRWRVGVSGVGTYERQELELEQADLRDTPSAQSLVKMENLKLSWWRHNLGTAH